ncbi:MAG TPA: hypothetical protein ENJ31_01650, partial [Anaerolineae bacterium]|nr:hypothetical protein [Anaerolineae bacterium]
REVDGRLERDLIRVRLFDVSPVSFPAYTETSAEVRARVAQLQAAGDPEAGDAADDGDGAGPQARLALRHRWLELAEREIYGGDTHV